MFVEFDWPDNAEHTEFCVNCYGEAQTYFLRDEKNLFNKDDVIRQLMGSCAEQGLAEQKVTTFESQGSPDIKKYFAMTEEGYGYVHVVNDDPEAVYKESINYTKFEKLELQKPFRGTSYEIEVKPGERKTVVIRQNDPTGFGMASQIMMSAVIHGPKKMEQLCVTKGIEKQRVHPQSKKPLEIY